ncbi:hypothetical protein CK203_064389 [Vitis vinifera]|uniref:Endonuclease/exonuclease/phosphatase domain-containing protein n=1 Tax=Vitis vinifera TaxID=29760 RepID=A0A438G6V1_VITVI|nr:hypothetical protein CK203_114308 [Vitis vinifera]RVW67936.1 hypothetical protein CK203_064389 [Vitis vinifera]
MGSRAPPSDMTGATAPPPMPAMWAWKPHLLAAPEERSPAPSPAPASSSVPDRKPPEGSVAQMDVLPLQMGPPPSKLATLKGKGFLPWSTGATLREAEVTPMKDGLTEIPNPDLEKDVLEIKKPIGCSSCVEEWSEEELSKLFHFSKVLGMPVEGHEVEILALLKKLKLRTGSSTLSKRRKKKSCITRFERELKRLECFVSYGGISGITKKSEKKANQGSGEESKTRFGLPLRDEGGLLLFWDNRVLENLEVESEGYSISVRFRNCANGFSWIFSRVYGPVIGSEKEDFWEELGAIRGLWDDLWRFSEVIGELGLRDSPLTGGPFTWIGGLNSQAASRLDHFLISDQWEDHFSAITQSALPRMVSDHSPIVLETGGLKIWNKEVLGNVSSNRAEDFARLQCWEAKEKENPLNLGDMEAKNLALEDYKKWALMEETS